MFILIIYLLDTVLILKGEILSWSFVGVKGLREFTSTISVNFQAKREQEKQLQLEDIILLDTNLFYS